MFEIDFQWQRFLQKQQTGWGLIQKHLVYLLDFKPNTFWELLLFPNRYFVGQNYTLILKAEKKNVLSPQKHAFLHLAHKAQITQ